MRNLQEWEHKYQENMMSCKPEYVSSTTRSFDPSYNIMATDNYYDVVPREPRVSPLSIIKPVKRRSSRACKKVPTTLLTANADNFRALVQQFTGCHSTFGANNYKGPINLSFSQHRSEKCDHKQHEEGYGDQNLFSFGGSGYNNNNNNIAISTTSTVTSTISDSLILSVPSTGNNSPMSHDQLLTIDDIEMVDFALQDLHQSELGCSYSALQTGTSINDEFWGY